tara:strand:- start:3065 stop:3577 length:513 start_codon:yes stop_codon:yes gene_type:complete
MNNILKKQDVLLECLKKFYSNSTNLNKFLKIIDKESNISLRAIDFLCTNYAKNKTVIYYLEKNNNKIPFNLYIEYRSQLKAYSKMQFDPFRRHERINLETTNGEIETTVAQLNFFKWAIEKKVLDWLKSNIQLIEKEMNLQISKKITKETKNELQKQAKMHKVNITVKFS